MKQYKGYYIDGVHFNTKNEIDNFIKAQEIDRYKTFARMFNENPSMELSVVMSEVADRLHTIYGLDYTEIEAIETAA